MLYYMMHWGKKRNLEFSYNRLNDLKLQECLVYCALFPEDYEIRRAALIGYWIVEGLVEEMGSRQAKYDRGHAILNKLENLCLLERCKNGKYVKMHDVVRDMAINITRRNSRFMVKIGRKLEDLPSETEWSNGLERVSLINIQLSSSMFVPDCPKLSTLFLQKLHPPFAFISYDDEGLPNEFFMHVVGSLRVLDLSNTSITFLPDSIYDMVNLRALLLNGCQRLEQVRSLAKLKELRRLNLRWTNLERLPDGIEKMVHLKEFKWSRCIVYLSPLSPLSSLSPLSPLSPCLLPNLLHLQCLTLNDERLFDVGADSAEELSRLRKLEILDVVFYNLHKFNSYVRKKHYQRLTHYRLQLNGREYHRGFDGLSKEVIVSDHKLIGGTEKEKENDEYYRAQLVLLPANLRILGIINCELFPSGGLLDVSPSLKMAMDLKACEIKYCDGIEYVWWADDCIASSLNTLKIENLPNLRVLFKLRPTENIASYSNSSLKHLFVGRCHNLKHLFTAELVKSHHLQKLHSISVYDCSELEDIIIVAEPEAAAEEEEGIISSEMNNDLTLLRFPNLQSLKLARLPKLKSIWKQGKMTCDSLKQLSVWNCPNLQRLPLSMETTTNGDGDGERRASSPPLKEIRGEKEWWDEVEWEPKYLFQSLFIPLAGPSTLYSWSWVSIILFYFILFYTMD